MITERQKEVICLIAGGKCDKEIAKILSISLSTVRQHRRNIYQRLHIKNAANLTTYAIKHKLIDVPLSEETIKHLSTESLTEREVQITQLAAGGLTNQEIATELAVKYCTVRKHRENIYLKFGVSNLAQLTVLALNNVELHKDDISGTRNARCDQ